MPERCVVPGCDSNLKNGLNTEGYIQLFKFPQDGPRKNEWIRAIPRKDWTPSDRARVCIKHFHNNDLITVEEYKDKGGNLCLHKRDKPALSRDAVPRIFPNLPGYLTDTRPNIKRKSPEERRKEEELRKKKKEEEDLIIIEENDKVVDFDTFSELLPSKVKDTGTDFTHFANTSCCILYKIDVSEIPKITQSIRVNNDLTVEVHVNGGVIPISSILSKKTGSPIIYNGSLNKWSQLNDLLNYVNTFNESKHDTDTFLGIINDACEKLICVLENNEACRRPYEDRAGLINKLRFLKDQIMLSFMLKPKYNLETILRAYLIYMQSVKCYSAIRLNNILTLPHPRFLQKLSSSFNVSPKTVEENSHFLKQVVKDLDENERIVSVQVDEIHIKENIDYKNGTLLGMASNDSKEAAKTIVAFLVNSCFSGFKETVRLIPVKQLTGTYLAEQAKNVISQILDCGLTILCMVSDNNRVNRVMFRELTKTSDSPHYFQVNGNPHKIFVLYDTVHIFKCVRNNWLNLKDNDKTFKIPFWADLPLSESKIVEESEDYNKVTKVKFSDIRDLYKTESSMLIRSAPHLTTKTVFPSSFERQKVNLVVNIFNEITVSALEKCGSRSTAYFVKVIFTWWTIVNINRPLTYIIKRNPLKEPFSRVMDARFIFIENFLAWLEKWRVMSSDGAGFLTEDTYNALHHTTCVIKKIITYVLEEIQAPYFLTAKLQTDNLESRFGQYRQLAGGNYNISVRQVMEAEHKIRIKSLLGLHSARYGEIFFSTKVCESTDLTLLQTSTSSPNNKSQVNLGLVNVLNDNYLDDVDFDKSGLLYVCGYITFKVTAKLKCNNCICLLTNQSELDDVYFKSINRGGLSVPSDFVVSIGKHVLGITQAVISEEYEELFLQSVDQRKDLVMLAEIGIQNDISINVDLSKSCQCGLSYGNLAKDIIFKMSNVLLNNYTKRRNDKLNVKSSKRKVKILSSVN